jgi:hypothetical protein
MKKTFFSLCFSFSLAFGAYSGHFAKPCYLCPSFFAFPSGYVFDRITDKNVKPCEESTQAPSIQKLKLSSNYGLFSLCLCRKIEFFTLLGKTSAEINWEEEPQEKSNTATHFSWQGGIRGHLFSWKFICLGFSASYFSVPNLKKNSKVPYFIDVDLSVPKSFKLNEWQVSLGCFIPLKICIPYFAVQYLNSNFDLFTKDPDLHIRYKNTKHFGYLTGACVNFGQRFFFSIEKRFETEEAISFSASYVF